MKLKVNSSIIIFKLKFVPLNFYSQRYINHEMNKKRPGLSSPGIDIYNT